MGEKKKYLVSIKRYEYDEFTVLGENEEEAQKEAEKRIDTTSYNIFDWDIVGIEEI